jgi:hypothetical protein
MGRQGVIYDYGYAPFIWSKKVWQFLEENFLKPNNMSISDAILECSSEFTWYGESLLKYRAITLNPCSISRVRVCAPIKPVAPVTRTTITWTRAESLV